MLSQLLIVQPW